MQRFEDNDCLMILYIIAVDSNGDCSYRDIHRSFYIIQLYLTHLLTASCENFDTFTRRDLKVILKYTPRIVSDYYNASGNRWLSPLRP